MPTTDPEPASSSATPSSRASSRSRVRSSPPRSRPSSPARPPDRRTVLDREVVAGPTLDAAKALLGAWLVRDPDPRDRAVAEPTRAAEPRIGRIVEVEAYIGEGDRASHARFGPTDRTRVMFGRPGIAYVYLVYGMYDCLNIVTEPEGSPAAVLVRAVEPATGIDEMRNARLAIVARRRTRDDAAIERERARLERLPVHRLATGPGLVAAAFSIDRTLTGVDLCDAASPLRVEVGPGPRPRIVAGPRVGVAYAGPEWASKAWRFAIAQSPSVSSPPIR